MKLKDKVYSVRSVVSTVVYAAAILLLLGIFWLVICLNYDNIEHNAKIFIRILAGFCFLGFLLFSVLLPFLLYKYPKYKKITYLFLQKRCFLPDSEIQKNLNKHENDNAD